MTESKEYPYLASVRILGKFEETGKWTPDNPHPLDIDYVDMAISREQAENIGKVS